MVNNSVLICENLQNCFIDNKSNLSIKNDDEVIHIINKLLSKFDLIVFTKNYHVNNNLDSCTNKTLEGDLINSIKFENIKKEFYIFNKGVDEKISPYSAFYDINKIKSTGLSEFLKSKNINNVYICGLTGDNSCKFTAIDSINEGFNTFLITDAIKFVSDNIFKLKEKNISLIESTFV